MSVGVVEPAGDHCVCRRELCCEGFIGAGTAAMMAHLQNIDLARVCITDNIFAGIAGKQDVLLAVL